MGILKDNYKPGDESPWKELGTAVDLKTRTAAKVFIQEGAPYPLPGVQFGTLIGEKNRFSAFVHPVVSWDGNKGSIFKPSDVFKVTDNLLESINELLDEHLIKTKHNVEEPDDLIKFELVEEVHDGRNITFLGCLRCS